MAMQVNHYLSLLKRAKAVPADQGSHPAFLGLPGLCHTSSQALCRGAVDPLESGLQGRTPACEEAVCVHIQWGRLCHRESKFSQ